MANNQEVGVFSTETAKEIKGYVDSQVGKVQAARLLPPSRITIVKQVWAKITDNQVVNGVARHGWKEVRWDFDQHDFVDAPDGKSGEKDGANYLISLPDAETPLEADKVVEASLAEDPKTGKNAWLALSSTSLPTGQYQFQMYGMVSQNQSGWTFILAHAME